MKLELDEVHQQIETYEHLGDIYTATINLIIRYELIIATQQSYISEKDADFSISHEFNIPQTELWQMVTSPETMNAIGNYQVTWSAFTRPHGRSGVGAVNHCAHGKGELQTTIIDWKPFDYFVQQGMDGNSKWYDLYEIHPLPGGDRSILTLRWKSDMNLPRWVGKLMGKSMVRKISVDFIKMIESYIEKQNKQLSA